MSGTRTERLSVWTTRHPWAGPTVWFAALFSVAASVAYAFVSPLLVYDEPAHFDYVLTVWHGHLPVFEDGLTYRAPFGWSTATQWTAQHPPLYYVLLSPVVGPLFDSGHPLAAVMAGRLIGAVLAGATVVAAAWAATRCFPGAHRLPGAAAIVVATCGLVLQQGGLIYNDILCIPLLVLACGIAGAAIRSGMGPGLLLAAVLVGAAGMTTRLSFALWLVAVVVATLLAKRVQLWRFGGFWARVVAAVAPLVAAAAASGWFYLRNKELSGNYSGRHEEWGIEFMGRTVRPFWTVATDDAFWTSLFSLYRSSLGGNDPLQWILLLGPMALAVVVGIVQLVQRGVGRHVAPTPAVDGTGREPGRDRVAVFLIVAMFVIVSVLLIIVEIDYVHGGGAPITRYALTLLPVIAIVMAAGLTGFRRLSGPLVAVWTVLAALAYWTLVDFTGRNDIAVPHLGLVTRVSLVVCALALLGCIVSAFVEARYPRLVPDAPVDSRPTVVGLRWRPSATKRKPA
ncbi:hypothetical protein C1N91_10510 [Curtobacterium sp. SGAir0471]|uniref:hypothetical protein n=1 Tax=Curtobacterium sp. SGAir0471 TaxID=2070337 RepID=UPI0010CD28D3|nr:hypothetical protein [Curtobacterium sp. SGAir0471]QCR43898.1 hypothetical protein C1N91_10510 [Curtobacterium sp. SGAir0471]